MMSLPVPAKSRSASELPVIVSTFCPVRTTSTDESESALSLVWLFCPSFVSESRLTTVRDPPV